MNYTYMATDSVVAGLLLITNSDYLCQKRNVELVSAMDPDMVDRLTLYIRTGMYNRSMLGLTPSNLIAP